MKQGKPRGSTMRTKREHCVKSVQMRSFFWSVFSHIWTEYAEVRSISPYSVRMRENMDQKKLRIWTLHAVSELVHRLFLVIVTQSASPFSKSTMETAEQCVKTIQSKQ